MRAAWWLLLLLSIACTDSAQKSVTRLKSKTAVQSANPFIQNNTNSQRSSSRNRLINSTGPFTSRSSSRRSREHYLFGLFEQIISALETKLQKIEKLDQSVEHLARKVENLGSQVNSNLIKSNAIVAKLSSLNMKLFSSCVTTNSNDFKHDALSNLEDHRTITDTDNLGTRLTLLDRKVSHIDDKLNVLKNQLDNNYLQTEDTNVEISEKKPGNIDIMEITKAFNSEIINHITKEFNQLRDATNNVDRKLQFHITLVSENLGKVLHMMTHVYTAIIEQLDIKPIERSRNHTTESHLKAFGSNKLNSFVRNMKPIINVSEKMDEVWDVVVGTKSSVDGLVPKSDELLTQTQRQERAIGEMHNDFRSKANKIIENLDMVEKRLKIQENHVATLAQKPVPAELLLDPTIDRLVEFNPTRFGTEDYLVVAETILPETVTASTISTASISPVNLANTTLRSSTPESPITADKSSDKRKAGLIFPSVRNKPSPNTTFTVDFFSLKDIKGYSCVDLLNIGIRSSGIYYLQIRGTAYWFLKAYCEQEIAEGGWTVIQRRDDFGEPRENFNRDWNDYKIGFGDPSKEFWLGNENIYMLTNNEEYILRIDLEDFEGNTRYAQYSQFKIYSEAEYYKLVIDGYEGNAGDSLNDPWYGNSNSPFSTYNRDNDRSSLNCASMLKGGWWWKSCGRGLNGLYLSDPQDLTARQGIVWFRWRGWDYTLKKASMMIKPKGIINNT